MHLNYVGVKDGAGDLVAADFTVSGMSRTLTLPAYNGARRLGVAIPATETDITEIYLYETGNRNTQNQINIFDAQTATVELGGETHGALATVDAQTGFGGFVLEFVQ